MHHFSHLVRLDQSESMYTFLRLFSFTFKKNSKVFETCFFLSGRCKTVPVFCGKRKVFSRTISGEIPRSSESPLRIENKVRNWRSPPPLFNEGVVQYFFGVCGNGRCAKGVGKPAFPLFYRVLRIHSPEGRKDILFFFRLLSYTPDARYHHKK